VIDGDVVVEEIRLDHPPEVVFEYFVDSTKLAQWIGIGADLQPAPGGRFRFEIEAGEYCEGTYLEIDRPRRVVFTWGWTNGFLGVRPGSSTVEIDLVPTGAGTLLRLTHRHLATEEARRMHAEGWQHFLARLTEATAGS